MNVGRLSFSLWRWNTAAAVGLACLLTGCASSYRVDSRVLSFATWSEPRADATTAPAAMAQGPQTYRFERLPSQREGEAATQQNRLEALVQEALAPSGWSVAEQAPQARWTVQVGASGSWVPGSPYPGAWPLFWPRFGLSLGSHGGRASGHLMWGGGFPYGEPPTIERKLSVVVRDAATGRVAYETQAVHDSRWNDSQALWRALVTAALRDFPAPPSGPRQVGVELPR